MPRSPTALAALFLPGLLLAALAGWWIPKEPLPVALMGAGLLLAGVLLGRLGQRSVPEVGPVAGSPPPVGPPPSPRPIRSGKVAHDINNVLTAINGRTELLLHALPGGHPLREDVLHIQDAGREAARLAATLLSGGSHAAPPPEILSPAGVVRDLLPGLRALLAENQTLSFQVQEPLPLVAAGRTGVEQMLENLVRNAVEAMPEGGRVTVGLSGAGEGLLLTVEDSGVGMEPEVQHRAFEPFFSGWSRGGSGLGLSTVQSLARRLGGAVELKSAPGEGTRVEVWLPGMPEGAVADDARDGGAPEAAGRAEGGDPAGGVDRRGGNPGKDRSSGSPGELPSGGAGGVALSASGENGRESPGEEGATILLVEDEELVRSLTERILTTRGYRVLSAAGGEEALALAGAWEGAIHLVLSDVVMPGMSGPETVGRLERTGRTFKVLYISGYTADHLGPYGVLDEGIELLSKPFGPDALADRVRGVLAG